MAARPTTRWPHVRWLALVLLTAGLVVLFLWREHQRAAALHTSAPMAGEATGARSAQPAAPGHTSAPLTLSEPLPAEELLPTPICLPGLLAFDQRVTLDEMRTAIAAAAASADEALQAYLTERLAELVGSDPARAAAVLGWAEGASAPAASIYLNALKQSEAVHHPSVPPKLLSLAEQPQRSPELRAAALSALESQRRLDDGAMQRLGRIALDESSEQTAWLATRTLGRVMTEDFERTGESGRYLRTLLDIGGRSADTGVRTLALEMPSYGQPLMPGDSIDELARMLKRDPDRAVREMAALRLSLTEAPAQALRVFEEAFPSEQDLCVRWAMFRFSLRAGGRQALSLLGKMATIEPRLRRDFDEFKALYDQGVVDFERIWQGKPEHIQCIGEHDGEG